MLRESFNKIVYGAALALLLVLSAPVQAEDLQEQTWTINFQDSDIQEVIKFVADATGKTVVISPQVKGKVKIISAAPLNSQQLYNLFISMLEVQGFTAIDNSGVVKVIPNNKARSAATPITDEIESVNDGYITQVIPLKNVTAAKIIPVLRPLVPQQSHLAAYESGNSIVISDTGTNIARIRDLIKRIDQAAVEKTEIVSLKYADAGKVVDVIQQLDQNSSSVSGKKSLTLVADDRTNVIIIKGSELERQRVKDLAKRMDMPGPQNGNVRVVYLEYAKAESLARILNSTLQNMHKLESDPNGSSNITATIEADEETNALLITAEGDTLNSLLNVIERLDIRRAQVLVEAIIVEIEDSAGHDLGIQWLFQNNNGAYGSSANPADGGTLGAVSGAALNEIASNSDDDSNPAATLGGALSSIAGQTLGIGRVSDDISFNVLLNALQQNIGANILSTPNLLTMDNHTASIVVGQNVPFITGSFTSTGNTSSPENPFQTIERESVGISLEVTPHINEGDAVVLDIIQEVSSLAGAAGVNASDVITNERKIDTQILIDDGDIVVLGGLIKDEVQEFKQKVPVLGSIPLMGRLFRTTSTTVNKTNLLVFIRANVIRDSKELTGATAEKYSYIREQQLRRKELGADWIDEELLPVVPEWNAPEWNTPEGQPTTSDKQGDSPHGH